MLKLATFILTAVLALPASQAVAQDGPTLTVQRLKTTVKLERPRKCHNAYGKKTLCYTKTRTGRVYVDQGAGFGPAKSGTRLAIGDRIRIRAPAIVTLSYASGCVLTLKQNGIYVVRDCDEDEDRDQDPDEESDDDSEDQDTDSELESQGGDPSVVNLRNILLTGGAVVAGKELYDELKDNDDKGDPASP